MSGPEAPGARHRSPSGSVVLTFGGLEVSSWEESSGCEILSFLDPFLSLLGGHESQELFASFSRPGAPVDSIKLGLSFSGPEAPGSIVSQAFGQDCGECLSGVALQTHPSLR